MTQEALITIIMIALVAAAVATWKWVKSGR